MPFGVPAMRQAAISSSLSRMVFPGRNFHFLGEETFAEFLEESAFVAAAVSAAEDGDAASLLGEGSGEDFHNRGLAGAAAGEVADADHETADRAVADHAVVVKPDPSVDRAQVEARRDEQEAFDKRIERAFPAFADDFDEVLFDMFTEFAQSHNASPMRASCSACVNWIAFQPRFRAPSMLQSLSSK